MNKYLKLIEASTPYAARMTHLRKRIFGEALGKQDPKNMKTVQIFSEKPVYMRDYVVNYYPRLHETFHLMNKLRKYGLYRDEHEDFIEEMKRQRYMRGKAKKVPEHKKRPPPKEED